MVTEFIAAVNQICSERGIDPEKVYSALEEAVLAAYKKEFDMEESDVVVELNRETGEFSVIVKKQVVKKVEDEKIEISLKDAQAIESKLEIGDTLEMVQQVEDYGRIAAQTAKQVVMQSIREAEKEAVLEEYSGKIGEVFTAMMHRMQGGAALFEIGKAIANMEPEDQIGSEFYRVGERYKVLLKDIEDTPKGKTLMVSRSDPKFLIELFKMEVPEIESGVVEVKECAREAGSRSKMAVVSHQDGVDPIGSCVGQRGIRIASVMAELGEEKIDVVEWKEDINEFVAKALSPAQVISVTVDDGIAHVIVEEDQLSLAIGKDGQNVRLAAKLTGLRIDIQGPNGTSTRHTAHPEVADESAEVSETTESVESDEVESKLTAAVVKKLEKAGKSESDAASMSVEELEALEGIGKATAQKIFEALN